MALKAKVLETYPGNVQLDITVRFYDDESDWSQDCVIIVPEEQLAGAELFIQRRIQEEGTRYKQLLAVYKANTGFKDQEFDIN